MDTLRNVLNKVKSKLLTPIWIVKDDFLRNDYLKIFSQKAVIGFVIDNVRPYKVVDASIRLRCYNVINELNRRGYPAELYKPYRKYEILIFTKCYSSKAVKVAVKAAKQEVPYITDVFLERFGENEKQENAVFAMLRKASFVNVYSEVQYNMFCKRHANVALIQEAVEQVDDKCLKKHVYSEAITLVYCGYSIKACDILTIKEVLNEIIEEKKCKLLLICEKDPQIEGVSYNYVKYDQGRIAEQIKEGDIFIAPRPMKDIDSKSYTLSKIALPMSLGIPVIASPIPSYRFSPAILCSREKEWKEAINSLIESPDYRRKKGREGYEFVKNNLSLEIVGEKYIEEINSLLVEERNV